MGSSCKEIAESVLACMKKTDCVKKGGGIKECMKSESADSCQALISAYATCRRQGLDMRTRIRGNRVY